MDTIQERVMRYMKYQEENTFLFLHDIGGITKEICNVFFSENGIKPYRGITLDIIQQCLYDIQKSIVSVYDNRTPPSKTLQEVLDEFFDENEPACKAFFEDYFKLYPLLLQPIVEVNRNNTDDP